MLRDTVVQVNLGVLADNMKKICEMVGKGVAVMPVIKADGYGHGAVGIAPTLMEQGAAYLAVATLTEALELRTQYKDYPVFILGHTPDRLLPIVVEQNITQTIFSSAQARILAEESKKAGKKAKIHIKVDTGFHRLGIDDLQELKEICSFKEIETEGIFSHLALVNEEENEKQVKKFLGIVDELEKQGIHFKYKHIADSIAAVDYPEYRMNMIRPGALVFGLRSFEKGFVDVEQAMTFVTRISQIRQVRKGEGVGYDYLWKAPENMAIGTLPFGYADGYPRNMRGKGYVTIKGVKCPIIGVICMDQCMVDLSGVPGVKEGDPAIIYGDGSESTMTIEEAAELAGTNKNEIVARISARPPREYIK
ncbi:alanine racemase [Aminipila luticellarii]|uniref:Alanine racemase n=1 Tax=Aminipila luticellarii TaxID=2507160 RepID=A0A410PU11_9FIRM|nr:alanine racemase [Aminipila luticellarii]QAT42413.1 alanine racemase [Aminipila luticellarii]